MGRTTCNVVFHHTCFFESFRIHERTHMRARTKTRAYRDTQSARVNQYSINHANSTGFHELDQPRAFTCVNFVQTLDKDNSSYIRESERSISFPRVDRGSNYEIIRLAFDLVKFLELVEIIFDYVNRMMKIFCTSLYFIIRYCFFCISYIFVFYIKG